MFDYLTTDLNGRVDAFNPHHALLGFVSCYGFLLKAAVIGRGVPYVYNFHTTDSFFYFSIAKSLFRGEGMVINSGVATNGFHPLYPLLSWPVFEVFYPFGEEVPILAVAVLFSILSVLTGLFLYSAVSAFTNRSGALLAATLWNVNPFVLSIYLSGMEVPVQIFFLSVLLYYWSRIEDISDVPVRGQLMIGVLLALIVLSRLDGGLIAIGVAASLVFHKSRGERFRLGSYRDVVTIAGVALTVAFPWFWNSYRSVGRITPVSSDAIHFVRLQLNEWGTVTELRIGAMESAVAAVAKSIVFLQDNTLVTVTVVLGVCFLLPAMASYSNRELFVTLRKVDFLVFSALLFYPFYILHALKFRFYYHLFTAFVAITVFSLLVANLTRSRSSTCRRISVGFVVAIVAINLVTGAWMVSNLGYSESYDVKKRSADYVDERISPSTRVGSSNGGEVQYYSEREVLVLAPVINPEAFRAWKHGSVEKYLVESNVTYIVDTHQTIQQFDRQLVGHDLDTEKCWLISSTDTNWCVARIES